MRLVRFGDVEVSRVVESEGPMMALSQLFPDVSRDDLEAHRSWLAPHFLDPQGTLILSIQTYVIRTKRNTVLIDTGVGDGRGQGTESRYLRELRRAGVSPEDVDFVVNTHLHVDHVGWNTRRVEGTLVPTFPRAQYLLVREEWEYWRGVKDPALGSKPVEENVVPIAESENAQVVPGDFVIDEEARLEPTPGHTPGHVAVHLESGGGHAVFLGDVFHHPVQVAQPGWRNALDEINGDPPQAERVRRALLNRYADGDSMILPAHFASPTVGHIASRAGGFRFQTAGGTGT